MPEAQKSETNRCVQLPQFLRTPAHAAVFATFMAAVVTFLYQSVTGNGHTVSSYILTCALCGVQAYVASQYIGNCQNESQINAGELAQANAELATANEKLVAQNRELDAFAHTVAHDLQAPVSVMLGYSTLMEAEFDNLPRDLIQNSLQVMVRQTERLGRIINELLMLSKIMEDHEVETAPVDMAHAVAEAVDRLRDLREEANPMINAPESWPASLGHAPWIEEVWCNYISNALKYGGARPVVNLGADLMPGGMIRYWVQDNGKGLNPAQQDSLFQRFARLDQVDTKGHGLGLSIVKRIVERLGGTVGVESAGVDGLGCTFWFTLPAAVEELQSSASLNTVATA